MAQGAIKKSSSKATTSSSRRPNILAPKKGARVIAPKKAYLVKKKKMAKKLSAGLTAKTERNLAEKAGHLEMLAGGKRGSKFGDKDRKGGEKKG